jgi:D-glycero-beta-D-manno-heptose-7-phosphate kinase
LISLSEKRVNDLIKAFPSAKILVIGDLMVDKYIWGTGIRLSTEAPLPVIKVAREEYALGGSANISYHLANLGAKAFICGVAGYDDAAYNMRAQIVKSGIEAAGLFPSSSRPTTQKIRIMSLEHSLILGRFDYESVDPLTSEEEAPMIRFIDSFLDDIDAVILSDYGRGVFKSESFIKSLKKLTTHRKILTTALCRTENLPFFSWVDYLTITYKNAVNFLHLRTKQEFKDIQEIGQKIWEFVPVKHIVISDGSNQIISLFCNGKQECQCSNAPSEVRDQTGLSDVSVAVMTLGLSSGASSEEAVTLSYRGMKCAGKQLGTGKITTSDLL